MARRERLGPAWSSALSEFLAPGPGWGAFDFGEVPSVRAVVALEDGSGRTVLGAITGDARGFLRRRLGAEDGAGAAPSPRRADLRAVVGRAVVIPVGSSFEAEACYLSVLRERMPREYGAFAERLRAWWVHVDPTAAFPAWTKTNLIGAERAAVRRAGGAAPRGGGVFLGPIPDKDAAGRFMEAVIDAFDLCRFHNILVQAPRGAPCAYKEMGRCAAPCDGSEAMESYRARVRGAVGFLERLAGGTAFEDVQGAIADASRAMDFERAAAMKAFVDRCGPLRKPGFAAVSTLERFRWIIAAPSGKKGWARLFWCDAGELSVLVDVRVQDGRNVIGEVAAGVVARPARACTASLPSESLDTLGLVSRWALDRGRKKKVALVRVGLPGEPPPVEDLTRAVRSAGSGKHDEGPMPEAEMESLV